jgi:hypothetical protein
MKLTLTSKLPSLTSMFYLHILQHFPHGISPCLLWVWLPIQTVLQLTTSQADVAVTVRKIMTKSFTYYCFFVVVKMMYCGSWRRRLCHDIYCTPVIVCLVSARGVMVIKGISNWDRFVDSKLVDMLPSGDSWVELVRVVRQQWKTKKSSCAKCLCIGFRCQVWIC